MHIGIVTFWRCCNYGAALQAAALKQICEGLGHQVDLLNTIGTHFYYPSPWTEAWRAPTFFLKLKCAITYSLYYYSITIWKKRAFERELLRASAFWKYWRSIDGNRALNAFSYAQAKRLSRNFDCFIAGSDQIWNFHSEHPAMALYFLDFVVKGTCLKIGYAGSLGTAEKIPEFMCERMSRSFLAFDAVSCRETDGAAFIRALTGQDVPVVLDPTLLLSTKEWELFVTIPREMPKKFVLVYEIWEDTTLLAKAKLFSEERNLELIVLLRKPVSSIGPREFLWYARNAEYVITNSFHATIFSILYQKQFLTLVPAHGGARIETLLVNLGLMFRYIQTDADWSSFDFDASIDWDTVFTKLNKLREFSLQWLSHALSAPGEEEK